MDCNQCPWPSLALPTMDRLIAACAGENRHNELFWPRIIWIFQTGLRTRSVRRRAEDWDMRRPLGCQQMGPHKLVISAAPPGTAQRNQQKLFSIVTGGRLITFLSILRSNRAPHINNVSILKSEIEILILIPIYIIVLASLTSSCWDLQAEIERWEKRFFLLLASGHHKFILVCFMLFKMFNVSQWSWSS